MDLNNISKNKGKISMVTCYDYSFARILNQSNVDIILVGDSLANVILGLDDTKKVSATQMFDHTAAVCRGAPDKMVIADMPYVSCQPAKSQPLKAARQFLKLGAAGVKIEWFPGCCQVIKKLAKENIPVMGHIGLTPQTAHLLGGYKIQGKNKQSLVNLIWQARKLESLGVFGLVLECIKSKAALEITKKVNVATIGIGSGEYCDGQVLVLYDLLGLYPGKMKFIRVFSNLSREIKKAVNSFDCQVKSGNFPGREESF